MIHSLEARRLLSASIDFDPQLGVLSVVGSEKSDRIEVNLGRNPLAHIDAHSGIGKLLGLPTKPGDYINVFDDGKLVYQNFLPAGTLQAVSVLGGGGDDVIYTINFDSPVPISVFGGDGHDRIDAANFGPATVTEIFAGYGNDLIHVYAGRDATFGFLVWGEEGDDVIYGSNRNDTLYGDVDDTVDRPNAIGNDIIYAGAGDDFLCGGDGDDILYGQDGNDWLEGCGGSDMLDGGAGEDAGEYDLLDKMVVDIEKLILVE